MTQAETPPLPGTMPDRLPEGGRAPADFDPVSLARALLRSIRGSRELAGCPEPPTPAFRDRNGPPYLDQLVRTIVEFVN